MPSPLPACPQGVVPLDADVVAALRARLAATARALTRDHHLADDLVQDTYAAVLAKPRLVCRGDELRYLRTALRNRFRDHLRRNARHTSVGDGPLQTVADLRVHALPEASAEHRSVLAAIDALPSPHREVIVAIDLLGLSYQEAADALHVPLGTIMSRLFRGRARVADRVAPALD